MADSVNLGLSGLASGFDWHTVVDQLTQVERAPQTQMRNEQSVLSSRNSAYSSIATEFTALKAKADALKDPSLFDGRSVTVGDTTLMNATASAGTALGIYTFNVQQLATASVVQGTGDVGRSLSGSSDVRGVVLSSAPFATAVTAGSFTVNGKQITVATTDTLQDVFDRITEATDGAVNVSYDATADKITLSGTTPIVLGSASDTSNFLAVAKLGNNGTDTVTSTNRLGTVKLAATLTDANLATAVSDGGAGAGQFTVNGVTINYNASTDTVAGVLARINNSTAGVTATYDTANDRFVLTNKTTGDVGVALADVTGNFLAATGLSSGTLNRGLDLHYTVNGGGQLASHSNTISDDNSGITGLSVTALKEGTTTITVGSNTASIRTAITNFIAEYNKAQALIDTNTTSSTDSTGKVTAGPLAGELEASELASKLRSTVNAVVSALPGSLRQLASLGIDSNGTNDQIELKNSVALDTALTNNLNSVKDLFTNSTTGLAVTLSSYLDAAVGDNGSLITKQSNLNKQISDIDTQVADQERWVQDKRQQLIDSFVAMESAQASISQQLQFLTQRFGGTTSQ